MWVQEPIQRIAVVGCCVADEELVVVLGDEKGLFHLCKVVAVWVLKRAWREWEKSFWGIEKWQKMKLQCNRIWKFGENRMNSWVLREGKCNNRGE